MMRNRRGWSLIELVVAIGILAILSTLGTLVQSKLLPHYRLSAATRQVVTDLRLLRAKAVSQNNTFRMIFDTGSNTYRAERWNTATDAWEHYALYRRGATTAGSAQSVSLPASVTATAAITVSFDPRGTVAITNGTQPLVLSAPGPRTRNVSVNVAGLITIS